MKLFTLILSTLGIDKKKLGMFVILFSAGFIIWWGITASKYSAEDEIPDNVAISASDEIHKFVLRPNGNLIDKDNEIKAKAIFENKADSLRFLVAKQNDTLIQSIGVTIDLPKPDQEKKIIARINSDGSLGGEKIYYQNDNTIVFTISDVAPESTVTVSLTLPKGYLDQTWYSNIRSKLSLVSFGALLTIGLIIPLVTLLTLLSLLYKSARRRVPSTSIKMINNKPDQTSPAVVGVLYRGKIGPREIAATLVDLANRGYLHIYKDKDEFRFAIPSFLAQDKFKEIKPFEKFLLSKLFQPDKVTTNVKEIGYRIGRHLFSRKVTAVLIDIYQQAVISGYFTLNPANMHRKYRTLATIEFFLGSIGLALSMLFRSEFQSVLITVFASTIISSFLIFLLAPTLPPRTESGVEALKRWLGFKKFLTKPSPIEYSEQVQEVYMSYLPYAIVFGVEVQWASRFLKSPFVMPEWLDSPTDITNIEDFANTVYPLVGYVGAIILQSHIPVVD